MKLSYLASVEVVDHWENQGCIRRLPVGYHQNLLEGLLKEKNLPADLFYASPGKNRRCENIFLLLFVLLSQGDGMKIFMKNNI